MSPVKTSAGGAFRFDRDFSRIGVGRIQRSSGTNKKSEFKRRDGILTKLAENAQIELLKALQRGDIAIEELVAADRDDKLMSSLSNLHARRPLWETFERTITTLSCAEATRRRYAVSVRALRQKTKQRLRPDARISDLADVNWEQLRAGWGGSAADWNHMRRAVSTLLSRVMGDKFHPFRRELVARIPIADEGGGRVPDLTPEHFWRIVDALPEHARPGVVVLVATGMRIGEYMNTTKAHLRSSTLGINVPGTKTKASKAIVHVDERLWPWIEAGVPAPLQEGWLRKYWNRACGRLGIQDLRLHDLRHCHGQWAVLEGVNEAAVQVALRHSTPEMTRRYTKTRNKGDVARAVATALLRAGPP